MGDAKAPADLQTQRNFRALLAGILLATASASAFSALLGTPPDRLAFVTGLMLATGLVSLLIGYGLYQRRAIRRIRTLHLSLLVNTVFASVVLGVNVSAIALSMLVTEGDTILITALLVFAALLAIVFSLLHSRLLTHDLRALTEALDHLGASRDLNARLARLGNDELANLAEAFNAMAARLRQAEQQQQQTEQLRRDLVAWVSHDLRTPLTALRVMNEALLDGMIADPDGAAAYLSDMNREILALGQLIDDLFELSLLEAGQFALRPQRASLRDLLSSLYGGFSARAAQHGLTFEIDLPDAALDPIWMAPDKIQRVLNNLVDNAIQYTERGGTIRIRAHRDGADVLVSVFNTGRAIPEDELRDMFTPFFRGDKARRDTQGSERHVGLGLAIARRFVEAHGGVIWADSGPDRWTTVSFRLPQDAPRQDHA